VLTPASLVDDVPTTFWYDDKPYEPANHLNKISGLITLRYALRRSINIATVRVAEAVGYDRVLHMAQRAGLGSDLHPTPALALGAYEASPLEVAGAYTTFVNGGVRKKPYFVRLVRDPQGRTLHRKEPEDIDVMDPRVAYVVTNMLEDVLQRGTGGAARYKFDFREPAAGKTGTDDDGWFAGFTDRLLCVVWVGFDDNRDLQIEGAKSALPIWAEFMKRAQKLQPYSRPQPIERPKEVIEADVDPFLALAAPAGVTLPAHELFLADAGPAHGLTIIRDPELTEDLAPTESFAESLAALTPKHLLIANPEAAPRP
jgi:penicillin-binding protein 1B